MSAFFIGSAGFRVKVRLKIDKVKPATDNDFSRSNNHLPICGRHETDYIGIVQHTDGLVRHLTYGDQRRLEVARAPPSGGGWPWANPPPARPRR